MTKRQFLLEASKALMKRNVFRNTGDAEVFTRAFMRRSKEDVETLANCVRYQFEWLYGFASEFIGVRSYQWLCKMIEVNLPSMSTLSKDKWAKAT
jgi:hypothetical protein